MLHGNEACQRCAYWQRLRGAAADQGLCRRQSPLLERASWPTTEQDDWCGEFVGTPTGPARLREARQPPEPEKPVPKNIVVREGFEARK